MSEGKDHEIRVRIASTALNALTTPVFAPTLFEPDQTVLEEVSRWKLEIGT